MRERILDRLRAAARGRAVEHPGPLAPEPLDRPPVDAFTARFEAAGGEVVRLDSMERAAVWVRDFAAGFGSAAVSPLVPEALRPALPAEDAERADLAVSRAASAAAETGSLLLDGREGRRLQLLAPVHLVWVRAAHIAPSLAAALETAPLDASAALALHSGPSKSADIGGMLVTGVHAPGRIIAAVLR